MKIKPLEWDERYNLRLSDGTIIRKACGIFGFSVTLYETNGKFYFYGYHMEERIDSAKTIEQAKAYIQNKYENEIRKYIDE